MTDATKQDRRLIELKRWLAPEGGEAPVEPASADASFRRYFRVHQGPDTYVAMDAPPDHEDCRPFVTVCERLREHGLNAPRIYRRDLRLGFLLLDDLGEQQYLAQLNRDSVESLYGDALDALLKMQTAVPGSDLPPYDRELLQREMALFVDWFLGRHLGIDLDSDARAIIDATFDQLVDNALEQPRVFVHRDYHSRNLMVVESNNPGILDFQDAVYGPITYDLVSLLRDCYIAWPAADVKRWVGEYHERLQQAGIVATDAAQFEQWFDLMGMQRHLKAIGIFARLNHRDGKARYLRDIPRTFEYVETVCARYHGLASFENLMRNLRVQERLTA